MANEIVSQSKFYIDYALGSIQLLKVKSADVDDNKSKEVVTAIGVDDGAGIRRKAGGGTITLEVYREQGLPEVDWRAVRDANYKFAFTIQDTGGQREQYFCEVSEVTRKDDDQGSHMDTVKLVFTRRKTLPNLF